MKKSILKDIRRSISLLLIFALLFGAYSPMGAVAANQGNVFYVHDNGRIIGILSCMGHEISNVGELNDPNAEKLIGFKSKYIILEDAAGFNIEEDNRDNVDITADVSINIDGRTIKIISYEFPHDLYNPFRPENKGIFSNASSVFMLRPVFYDDNGQKITYNTTDIKYHNSDNTIDAWYANQNYADTNGIYGLHPDFRNYMTDKFGIENVNSDYIVAFLSSLENEGKIYVSYTLSDGNNTATVTYNDYRIYKYETIYPVAYGYRLNYSRIEDMTDYHEKSEFNSLKMYKGDLYVDADKIGTSESTIILPNLNRTGLSNLKSLEIGNDTVYNDNDEYIITTDNYNIIEQGMFTSYSLASIFPNGLITNVEDAVYYFLQVCYSDYDSSNASNKFEDFIGGLGLNKNDYADESTYNDAVNAWKNFAEFHEYDQSVYIYKNGKEYIFKKGTNEIGDMASGFKFECYNSLELSDIQQSFWAQYGNGDELDTASFNLPFISLNNGELEKEKLTNYKTYLQALNDGTIMFLLHTNTIDEYRSIKDLLEYPYSGNFENGNEGKNYTFDEVMDILDKLIDYIDETGNDYIDADILGEEYRNLTGFKQNFDGDYDLSGYKIYGGVAQTWLQLALNCGIEKTGAKIYAQKEWDEDDMASPDALMSYLIENDILTAFEEVLIQENGISFDRVVTTEKLPDNDNSVTVSSEQIQIPVRLLNQNLGVDNVISRYYYMNDSFFIYMWEIQDIYDNNCEGTMLYHGVEKAYYYKRYNIGQYNSELNGNIRLQSYIIPYDAIDALYLAELTNLKFAKVPEAVITQTDVYKTTDEKFTVTWEKPEDNGAEIIGYQIAVVPKGTQISNITDDDFYTLSNLSYKDLGDNYVIPYTTQDFEYELPIGDTSKDIYIRAVNVIGPGPIKKITVNYELEFRIVGPDEVYTGSTTNYDTVDYENNNLEPDVIYSLKDNPNKVSIDSNGNLIVDKDCKLDSVVIISIGKEGTEYEGRRAEKLVRIIKPEQPSEDETTNNPNKIPESDKPTENETTPNDTMGGNPPQTGDETNVNRFFVLGVLSGVVLLGGLMLLRKRKED